MQTASMDYRMGNASYRNSWVGGASVGSTRVPGSDVSHGGVVGGIAKLGASLARNDGEEVAPVAHRLQGTSHVCQCYTRLPHCVGGLLP